MKRLWEVKHPYYCSENNWFSNEYYELVDSWEKFGMRNSEPELNLLFRWDWRGPVDDDGEPTAWSADETLKESILQTFWMLQRKGKFTCFEVRVSRSEEPEIRAWLESRLPHILALWTPLIPGGAA